jgi:RNA polymerase sigma-70 factor (ECF subfamily)
VCGLSTLEIARAFLVSETTMAQRLSRAKAKIADAGVPFELPAPHCWPERLDAVLATVEIAYGKAHEDAAASGIHAHFAAEMLELTGTLVQLMPSEAEPAAVAAMVRLAEARRPARIDSSGFMVPLSEQDPQRWQRPLIEEAIGYLDRASAIGPDTVRVIQAKIHAAWCSRHNLESPPPWPQVLSLYDALLMRRDDPVVRLNRVVAVAEVHGVESGLLELESLDGQLLRDFAPYHAVRADLLRRAGRTREALRAYDEALSRIESDAERRWLTRQRNLVLVR